MPRRSNPLSENDPVPDWFNLDNYNGLNTFPEDRRALGWLLQIAVRRDCYHELIRWEQGKERSRDQLESTVDVLSLIWDKGVVTYRDVEEVSGPIGLLRFPTLVDLVGLGPRRNLGVHPTTITELYQAEMVLKEAYQAYAREFWNEIRDVPVLPGENLREPDKYTLQLQQFSARLARNRVNLSSVFPDGSLLLQGKDYREWMEDLVYEHQYSVGDSILFCIDVSLPDKLLEGHLRVVLKDARAFVEQHRPKMSDRGKDDEKKFRNWIDYGVIPYIDLRIWNTFDQTKITLERFADIIASSSVRKSKKTITAESVRRTVHKYSDEFMGPPSSLLRILRAEAAAELLFLAPRLKPDDPWYPAIKLAPGFPAKT